ncbi:SEC-C domain-containing protein [Sphingobacterium multivorum]|uniref:SEC-C domain-containing protein n=1 Tax=Sphingobacterium multivorum TaxID=28454 RepID=A0ABX7CJ66_SPHMU|nr:SEC-C domain-containing protein [Sphingobacterium multivorum]QQT52092.1 SEC-C domain-containing protein [Sphingobacterium multivorum]
MNSSYNLFIKEAAEAMSNFPDLQLSIREDSLPSLAGEIYLLDQEGILFDKYSIKIDCTINYPDSFPLVYETNGRLPHNIEWHVYQDGHFCICTPIEEYIHCAKGITLTDFINNHILPYLHNQSFREKEGYFLNERSHGISGLLESLYSILKVNSADKVFFLLNHINKNRAPSRTSKCFCGSSKKYRHCHRSAYQTIKSIEKSRLKHIMAHLKKFLFYH